MVTIVFFFMELDCNIEIVENLQLTFTVGESLISAQYCFIQLLRVTQLVYTEYITVQVFRGGKSKCFREKSIILDFKDYEKIDGYP